MAALGWTGKQVRNTDGRTGCIARAVTGFGHVSLFIEGEDGAKAYVQLNAFGADSGETGWAWLAEDYFEGPAWLPLGDHHELAVQPDEAVAQ